MMIEYIRIDPVARMGLPPRFTSMISVGPTSSSSVLRIALIVNGVYESKTYFAVQLGVNKLVSGR